VLDHLPERDRSLGTGEQLIVAALEGRLRSRICARLRMTGTGAGALRCWRVALALGFTIALASAVVSESSRWRRSSLARQ